MKETTVIKFPQNNRFTSETPDIIITSSLEKELRKNFTCIGIKELEQTLRLKIDEYRKNTKKGYRSISADIEEKIRKKMGEGEEEIEKLLENRVPSHTYIGEFHKGRNICINYMNSIAYFFNVSYIVNNFNLEV